MPRPRLYDDALRTRLLEAASVALTSSGSDGVSVRAVSQAAQTTTAAVYALFGSRDALLQAVVAEGLRRFADHLDAVPRTDDAGADLLRLGLAYRESALAEPHFYRAMFSMSASWVEPTTQPTFQRLREAASRLLPPGADPQTYAVYLWSLVHGLVSLELGGHLDGDEQARTERYREVLMLARRQG